MLGLTLAGFGLPIYLWMYKRRMRATQSGDETQPFSVHDNDDMEEYDDGRSSSSEDDAPYLSSIALAL